MIARSSGTAAAKSVGRGTALVRAAATVLERANGDDITVQDVADEAGQSLRTLYQFFAGKDDLLLAVYEEAMRRSASSIREAIADLDDPVERLAGAIIAAVRMPSVGAGGTALDRGLARLRLKLSEVAPELVGRAQSAMTSLFGSLVSAASAAGSIDVDDTEAATSMVLSLAAAFVTAETLGNHAGLRRPDVEGITTFCLNGLRAELPAAWFPTITSHLRLPTP